MFLKHCSTTFGGYKIWANLHCSGCAPLGEKSLWNGTIVMYVPLTLVIVTSELCVHFPQAMVSMHLLLTKGLQLSPHATAWDWCMGRLSTMCWNMMSWDGNAFFITGPLWKESTAGGFPSQRLSIAKFSPHSMIWVWCMGTSGARTWWCHDMELVATLLVLY